MNQENIEQGWQKLESRIDNLFGKYLRNDIPAIEHKPTHLALLQLPPNFKINVSDES